MRRHLAAAAVVLVAATQAAAHSPARLRVASPEEGARVAGDVVRVVVVGEGGDAAAAFRVDLDGQPVDATGRIGGIFTTLSVAPNEQVTLDVPVTQGEHTLTFTPNPDPDSQQETVVRRFTVVPADGGAGTTTLVLAAVAVAGAVGTALLVRRKAATTSAD